MSFWDTFGRTLAGYPGILGVLEKPGTATAKPKPIEVKIFGLVVGTADRYEAHDLGPSEAFPFITFRNMRPNALGRRYGLHDCGEFHVDVGGGCCQMLYPNHRLEQNTLSLAVFFRISP